MLAAQYNYYRKKLYEAVKKQKFTPCSFRSCAVGAGGGNSRITLFTSIKVYEMDLYKEKYRMKLIRQRRRKILRKNICNIILNIILSFNHTHISSIFWPSTLCTRGPTKSKSIDRQHALTTRQIHLKEQAQKENIHR